MWLKSELRARLPVLQKGKSKVEIPPLKKKVENQNLIKSKPIPTCFHTVTLSSLRYSGKVGHITDA